MQKSKSGFRNLQMTIDETEESFDLKDKIKSRGLTKEIIGKVALPDPNTTQLNLVDTTVYSNSIEQIEMEEEDFLEQLIERENSIDEDLVEDTEKVQNDLIIFVYQKHSFLSTHQLLKLKEKSRNYYDLRREIIDKKLTQNHFQCQTTDDYIEDECLTNCLISKFVADLGCLHARLFKVN